MKIDYIDSNLPLVVEHYRSIFEEHKSIEQINKLKISILDQYKNEIGKSENLIFSKFLYSSQD
jgi:hypothetical protein